MCSIAIYFFVELLIELTLLELGATRVDPPLKEISKHNVDLWGLTRPGGRSGHPSGVGPQHCYLLFV